jgi:hypothetical protein
MGVLRRRYADPLKYASRGSTLSAAVDDDDDCADISKKIIQKFTAKGDDERERRKLIKILKIIPSTFEVTDFLIFFFFFLSTFSFHNHHFHSQ